MSDVSINNLTGDGNVGHVAITPDQDVQSVVDTLQTVGASPGISAMITEQGPGVNGEKPVGVLGDLALLRAEPPK